MNTHYEVNIHLGVTEGAWPSHTAQTRGLTFGPWVPMPRGPEGPGGPLTPASPWKDTMSKLLIFLKLYGA